jgi:hypothetical protein
MFGEFALLVLTCIAFLSLASALIGGERRIGRDPIIDESARIFAAVLSAGLTIVLLKYKPQFAVLGAALLVGFIVEHIKERN